MTLNDMPAIQQRVINDAVRNLKAAGCQYAIILPSGEQIGELKVVVPAKRTRVNHFTQTGYLARVDAMKVGDVEVFDAAGMDIQNYRSAISARGIRTFGKGSINTCIEGTNIQIMRLS